MEASFSPVQVIDPSSHNHSKLPAPQSLAQGQTLIIPVLSANFGIEDWRPGFIKEKESSAEYKWSF